MNSRTKSGLVVGLLLSCQAATLCGDERLAGIACRSVHLGFPAQESVAFYNELTIEQSAPGTYFMVCGWQHGYFGAQELGNGKKLLLFSVWDPGAQDDPKTVAEDRRVKLLHQGDGVRVGRFGGEGTGGQSFFDYDWKIGQRYRFLVTATANEARSEYAGYFFLPDEQKWKHLVTFSTPTEGALLRGMYSFVEDFRRDRVSTTKTRRANFGNGWVRGKAHDWEPLLVARFTADANPVTNIDAGIADRRFWLATGGAIQNATTKLRDKLTMPAEPAAARPMDLPQP